MPNTNTQPVPVLAGELGDLMAELRKYYTSVWIVIENCAGPGEPANLEMRLHCLRWEKGETVASKRLRLPLLAHKPPHLAEQAYNLLWGAIDALILQGHLPVFDTPGEDPA